ncbi:MAG: hypothetical protein HY980_03250 [Candidatus Magasanikbacteria bacterium]|nr:hypothetical protein [Candidatus Magasanikbacteria bacterium]
MSYIKTTEEIKLIKILLIHTRHWARLTNIRGLVILEMVNLTAVLSGLPEATAVFIF